MAPATGSTPSEALTDKQAPEASPLLQTVAGIVSALLLTTIVAALGVGQTANLVAAVLGVAIPQFITYVGPRRHLRLGVAIVVTIVALFLTYGGVKLFDAAANKQTFPDPVPSPAPSSTAPEHPTPSATATLSGPRRPRITVEPDRLTCTAKACSEEITITSTGSARLRTYDILFEEGDVSLFRVDPKCARKFIPRATPCTFGVTFHPTDDGPHTATLVIHQNVGRTTNEVIVEGSGGPIAATGDAAFAEDPTCERDPESGELAVAVTARADTPGELRASVYLEGDESPLAEDRLTTDEEGLLGLPNSASGAPVTVRLDALDDDDTSNNEFDVTCDP